MTINFLKKTVRILILFLFVLTLGVVINSFINAVSFQYPSIFKEMNLVLKRAEYLSKKSQNYIESQTLSSFGNNPLNGNFIRLDEGIRFANIRRLINTNSQNKCFTEVELNFQDPVQIPLSTGQDSDVVASGSLIYKNLPDKVLTNRMPLEIYIDELASVQIRMRLSKSKRIYWGWSTDPYATIKDKEKIYFIKIFSILDNQFHDYTIDGAAIANEQKDRSIPIRKIFLMPEAQETIEINHIRFESKINRYLNQGTGVVYEKLQNETRRCMFIESGHELQFDIEIPPDQPHFKFGIGKIHSDPILIRMLLRNGDHCITIFNKNISGDARWEDEKIDLSSYSGMKGRMVFCAEGKSCNAVLISNPIIVSRPEKTFNCILVVEDSLRADRLSCRYPRVISPVKKQWGQEGVIFTNAYSQASFTRASCASFLTSLRPGATGVWSPFDTLDNNYTTLPELLRHQGFATLLVSQIVNVGEESGLHQGFDQIIDFRTVGIRASEVYESNLLDQWIEKHSDQNKFIYLHIFDPHHPYQPPENFISDVFGKPYLGGTHPVLHSPYFDPPWLKQPTVESRNFLYDEEICFNDIAFAHLLQKLKQHGIYDNTLLIFTSDHGEFLGEHGLWGHMPPNYQEVLHVPLIMVYPDIFPSKKTIEEPVQLLDITPTILSLASVPTDKLLLHGDSLVSLIQGESNLFWRTRICISDEIQNSHKNDIQTYQSIIYQNFHIVLSNAIHDEFHYLIQQYPVLRFFKVRTYDLNNDHQESHADVSLFAYLFFNYKIGNFMKRLRMSDLEIWRNMTQNTAQPASIQSDILEQLKTLGYVK